jgi:Domain of unknown function (DUF4872)/Butirosin biosynthesis protein H, N-terminal
MSKPAREFEHAHSAHCESGAFAALLRHNGLRLTESMVFGIGSGLFFLYFPLVKIYDAPLVAYRDAPNAIMTRSARRLGVRLKKTRYRDADLGMRALDDALAEGVPVGMQTGVFWLPYFPRDMRFQFNGHHVIAYAKEADEYLLSDTVFEAPVRCHAEDLRRARFSKGPLAPKGLLYRIVGVDSEPDLVSAVRAGLKTTAWRMLKIPLRHMGVNGIRTLAHAMAAWPEKLPEETARHWLANTIRMQEEIGTGGGGFRYMYAAFLDEAADILSLPALHTISEQISDVGDRWRDFAVAGAQVIQGKDRSATIFRALSERILECANREEIAFTAIRKLLK